jgi:predicted thioesterase
MRHHAVWVPAFAGTTLSFPDHPMDAREIIKVGMSAERALVVPPERTVGHFVPDMPMVYATPMMILEMEMASADAINRYLEPGWVTVGTEVDIRHLAASPVGAKVRTTARVIAVERRVIRFAVEAFDDKRRIGEGRHARGLVNVETFTKRFGAS